MSKFEKKNSSGLLVCGACAVVADPESDAPSSIEMLAEGVRNLFARKSRRAAKRRTATVHM